MTIMNEIASEIHGLVRGLCEGVLTESEFTSRLSNIEHRHPNPGNIGRAIDKGLRNVDSQEADEELVWRLTESVNSEIKSEYDEWTDASSWDIG